METYGQEYSKFLLQDEQQHKNYSEDNYQYIKKEWLAISHYGLFYNSVSSYTIQQSGAKEAINRS